MISPFEWLRVACVSLILIHSIAIVFLFRTRRPSHRPRRDHILVVLDDDSNASANQKIAALEALALHRTVSPHALATVKRWLKRANGTDNPSTQAARVFLQRHGERP